MSSDLSPAVEAFGKAAVELNKKQADELKKMARQHMEATETLFLTNMSSMTDADFVSALGIMPNNCSIIIASLMEKHKTFRDRFASLVKNKPELNDLVTATAMTIVLKHEEMARAASSSATKEGTPL